MIRVLSAVFAELALSCDAFCFNRIGARSPNRATEARCYHVHGHGGLQRASPTKRGTRARFARRAPPHCARSIAIPLRARSQNDRRRFPAGISKRTGGGAMRGGHSKSAA